MTITQSRLHEVLIYDPRSGEMRWRVGMGSRAVAGQMITRVDHYGYIAVGIDGKIYKAHRMAWLYQTGWLPTGDIDHANGVRTDNRFQNLRCIDRRANLENKTKPNRNSTTGFLGVTRHRDRFIAQITVNWKCIRLGVFATAEEASACYLAAKLRLHKGYATAR